MADINTFKKLIRFLESSGGQNMAHRTMASGMHAGDTAVGASGLMPKTAQEMASRRINAGTGDINDTYVKESASQDVQAMLSNNDDLRARYVDDMANMVVNRTKGDPELGATAWLYGHNYPNSKLKELLTNDPEYKNRINNAIEELHLQSNKPTFDVKALEEALGVNREVKPYSKINNVLFKK